MKLLHRALNSLDTNGMDGKTQKTVDTETKYNYFGIKSARKHVSS